MSPQASDKLDVWRFQGVHTGGMELWEGGVLLPVSLLISEEGFLEATPSLPAESPSLARAVSRAQTKPITGQGITKIGLS